MNRELEQTRFVVDLTQSSALLAQKEMSAKMAKLVSISSFDLFVLPIDIELHLHLKFRFFILLIDIGVHVTQIRV